MVLALDPRIPRVWRTPDSIQFGVDDPVLILRDVSPAEERLLAALETGLTPEGLRMVAERVRADDRTVAALLERLAPVLVRRQPTSAVAAPSTPPPSIAIDGRGTTAATLERLLTAAGAHVRTGASGRDDAADDADAAVIVASYAVDPLRHARWLRRDVPHLPVVFGDRGVTVGPFVRPGLGPCLRCVDLHRTDADPAWPAMATQLHTRRPPGETAIAAAAAAARAATVLLLELDGRGEVVLARDGPGSAAPRTTTAASARLATGGILWVSRAWAPHPDCGCLGLPP